MNVCVHCIAAFRFIQATTHPSLTQFGGFYDQFQSSHSIYRPSKGTDLPPVGPNPSPLYHNPSPPKHSPSPPAEQFHFDYRQQDEDIERGL